MENKDNISSKMAAVANAPRLNPIEKLATKPKSKSLAIKAKCFECMGGCDADSGWRKMIGNCTSYSCPLYDVRPYQSMKVS